MSKLRLTSSGLIDVDYTGLRLTSDGLVEGSGGGVSLPPVARDDGPYHVLENETFTLLAPGILANDDWSGGAPAITTKMLTFDGATSYGELAEPWVSTDSDWTLEIVFDASNIGNWANLLNGAPDGEQAIRINMDNTGLISVSDSRATYTLDGVAFTDRTMLMPRDGNLHTIVATGNSLGKVGVIAVNTTADSLFANATVKSLTLTDNTTPANSRVYTLDSGSIVKEVDDLNPSDSTNDLIYNNVVAEDWADYTYNATSADCSGGPGWEHDGGGTTVCIV